MNTISKNRLLTTVVILLLLANVVSLATFWLTREKQLLPLPPGNGGSAAADFLIRELNFDTKQQAAYKILKEEHQQQTKISRENVREFKKSFFDLLNKDSVSSIELKWASEDIGKNEGELQLYTFNHFRKVRALCNDEQKKKFDSIIQQVLRMMGGQQGPPPPKRMDGDYPPPPERMHDDPPPPPKD